MSSENMNDFQNSLTGQISGKKETLAVKDFTAP